MRVLAVLLGVLVGSTFFGPIAAQTTLFESELSPIFFPLKMDSPLLLPIHNSLIQPTGQQDQTGWGRLSRIGPGRQVVVTFADGTMRGGRIVEVLADSLRLDSANQIIDLPRSDIVLARIQRGSYTVQGGLVGFLVSGLGWTIYACSGGGDCGFAGGLLVFTLTGAPGGLVGALIGSQAGGDVEIIF